jgi:hypothetical protein
MFAVFFGVTFSHLITEYWIKVVVLCICVGVIGFAIGFTPGFGGRGSRAWRLYGIATIWVLPLAQQAATQLAHIYELPVDARYPTMGTAVYLAPFFLIIGSEVLALLAGMLLFRHLYPDQAFVVENPEDRKADEEARKNMPSVAKVLLLVFLTFSPSFVASFLYPKYALSVILATCALWMVGFSTYVGVKWNALQVHGRRLFVMMACLGPPAGFVGRYNPSSAHVSRHLIPALGFAAWIGVLMLFPFLVARGIAWLRKGSPTTPV